MSEQTKNTPTLEEHPEGTAPSTPGDPSPAEQPVGRLRLNLKFTAGFLGWYLVVWLIYRLMLHGEPDPQGYGTMIISLLVFPAQITILVILLAVKTFRQVGWGMLSAIAVNLLLSLLMGLGLNAICFIPFFTPTY